jgi:hypothetical protein
MVQSDLAAALSERMRVRDALEAAFEDGLQIAGFDGAANSYVLA